MCRENINEEQAKGEDEVRKEKRPFLGKRGSFLAGMLVMAGILVGGYSLYMVLPIATSTADPGSLGTLHKVREITDLVDAHALQDPDPQLQSDYMMLGLMAGLEDPYAAYYTEDQYSQLRQANDGYMDGIGISIVQQESGGDIEIVGVAEESPAEKAGVQAGDVLREVDGVSVVGKTSEDVVQMIQKSAEGTVKIAVLRQKEDTPEDAEGENSGSEEELLYFSIKKEAIELDTVQSRMLEGNLGYIQIKKFNGLTAEKFAEAYETLQEDGMRGLIIDLRDNPGGLVQACCDTLECFMPKGVLVVEEDARGNQRTRECEGETPIELPLVLVVNENTASAAEMFAGAVQDHGVGSVVGEVTYGKGVEQNTFVLEDGSAVKLTTAEYFTPDHHEVNGVGITPDFVVEMPEDLAEGEDPQLDRAVDLLQEKLD